MHLLLWLFDSLPLSRIAFSIICHLVYLTNFTPHWPMISLSSYSFISSCILVLADHFIWFTYFSQRTHNARQSVRKFGSADWRPLAGSEARMLTFMDIATFFGVCVWLVPLFLFLSLSANDNALPMSLSKFPPPLDHGYPLDTSLADDPATPQVFTPNGTDSLSMSQDASYFDRLQSNSPLNISTSTRPTTLFQRLAHPVMSILPRLRRSQKIRSRDDTDGLIAPARQRTPVGSPLPSPRSSPPPELSSPSTWRLPPIPPSPSGSRHAHEASGLGVSVGYGRATPPFLQPPPLRRATTDALSPSRSNFGRSAGYRSGNGSSESLRLSVPESTGMSRTPSPGLNTSATIGRRRLATNGEDVFDS